MRMVKRFALLTAVLTVGFAAEAAVVTFDFDTGAPPLYTGQSVPFDQTTSGVTAHFSSPQGAAFSLQTASSTFFNLSQFSGKFVYPNNLDRNQLNVWFSQNLTSISVVFATVEYQDNAEVPSNIRLTAYGPSGLVGTAVTHAAYLGDTFPMGTLAFDSGGVAFDHVEIVVPFNTVGTTNFLADNMIVHTVSGPTAAGSVPLLLLQKGVGGAIDVFWSPSCVATDVDYAVYEGQLGNFPSHLPRVCSTSGATSATIVPDAGSAYYLVVPHNGAAEGSYGTASGLIERPPSPAPCFAQALGTCP